MSGRRGRLIKAARFGAALPAFLATPLDPGEAEAALAARITGRAEAFLDFISRAVFQGPSQSPYRRLLDHAGVEIGDLELLVRQGGVEGALAQLHEEGIRVTLDEFRGLRPIRRGSLEVAAAPEDFDNPLLGRAYVGHSGGTRSAGRPVLVDLALFEHEARHEALFLRSFDLLHRPYAIWRPAPPGRAGLNNALRHLKLGLPVERWFSQYRTSFRSDGVAAGFSWWAPRVARAVGLRLPSPQHVPLERAEVVARWLADQRGVLDTPVSSGVRACRAASNAGLDLSGAFLRLGGESFTAAKARAITSTGARAACHYSMAELGRVGVACADATGLNDVHLLTDKLAVLTPPGGTGAIPEPLHFTTLMPASPKLMLNVDVGDQAIVERRRCACLLGRCGFSTHLREIRSEEKLTSEGMTFFKADLLTLVDEVLPSRFGGGPGDFQLVERETARDGLPAVEITVDPEVPPARDEDLIVVVLEYLGSGGPAGAMMAEQWRQAGTLTVARRRPEATAAAKLMPLRVVR